MSLGEVTWGSDVAGTPATNGYLTLGQSAFGYATGAGGPSGDQDWYFAYLQAGTTYTIDVGGVPLPWAAPLPDAYLEVYDSFGNYVDGFGSNTGAVNYTFTSPITGFVYFNVSGYDVTDVGGYGITLYTAPDDHGGNLFGTGAVPGATPIQNAVTFTGSLERPGDTDSFAINATAGVRYFWALSTTVPDIFATIDNSSYQRQTYEALPGTASGELYATYSDTYMLSFSSNSFVGTGSYQGFVQAALSIDKELVVGSVAPDTLYGTGGADELSGWDGNDQIKAGSGADYVLGNRGNDILSGGSGNDVLWGDEGADKLDGGTENDRLIGGLGRDTLTGSRGKDVFVFDTGDTRASKSTADYITDFSGSLGDRIDLRAIDANVKKSGNQAFSFIGTKAFTAAGQVRYEKTASDTYILFNTDADASAEGVIRLKGAMDLQKGWFVL